MPSILFSSIISHKIPGKGMVQVDVEAKENNWHIQMFLTPDEAENMSRQIVQIAEAARTDEFLLYWAKGFIPKDKGGEKVGEEFGWRLIQEFRRYRELPTGKARCPTCGSSDMTVIEEGGKFVAQCNGCKGKF